MKQTKILVTAFEPFDGEKINPAWEGAKKLSQEGLKDVVVTTKRVPTVFGAAIEMVVSDMEEIRPDLVVALGQAGGRTGISVERVAINVDDAAIPDNARNQPVDVPIVEDGPAAYFSTLPIKAMVEAIKAAGIPASVSNSAGTFVCNHLMYGILHHIDTRKLPIKAGFIHLPFLPQQAVNHKGAPSMSLQHVIVGLKIALLKAAELQ